MAGIVFGLLEEGHTEQEVMERLGMEAAEVARITHITGFSRLLEDHEYSRAMTSKRMMLRAKELDENHYNVDGQVGRNEGLYALGQG